MNRNNIDILDVLEQKMDMHGRPGASAIAGGNVIDQIRRVLVYGKATNLL